ncbi:MAG: substrate-binding domain-containing protein, partial [Lachnospiraceae bacterium]|nr:substrate-binding domain-containing protein [Lachnospiraceae bacterium]
LIIHTKNDITFTRELMKAMRPNIDACLATDDAMAVGVIKYALDRGISIPDDLSVIGYNNSALAVASTPELTSIDNRLEKNCQDTLSRLFSVLSGATSVPRKTSVACKVAERETTAF